MSLKRVINKGKQPILMFPFFLKAAEPSGAAKPNCSIKDMISNSDFEELAHREGWWCRLSDINWREMINAGWRDC